MKGKFALIPCYNEELTVGKVVDEFRKELPKPTFTYLITIVKIVRLKRLNMERRSLFQAGKGHAVQAMFDKIEADYYVMVDGDDTYPAKCA